MRYFVPFLTDLSHIADAVIGAGAVWLVWYGVPRMVPHWSWFGLVSRHSAPLVDIFALCFFSALYWGIASAFTFKQTSRRWSTPRDDLRRVVRVNLLCGMLLLVTLASLGHLHGLGRTSFVVVIATAAMYMVRLALRAALGVARRRGRNSRQVLIVGDGRAAQTFAATVERRRELGMKVVGYLVDKQTNAERGLGPCLGRLADLTHVLHQHAVDVVVVALSIGDLRLPDLVNAAEMEGKEVRVMLDDLGARLAVAESLDFYGQPMVRLTPSPIRGFAEPLKRTLDLFLVIPLFFLSLPVLLWAMMWVKLDDPSAPVIYGQRRVGQNGREFTLYKLRTMVQDAEALRWSLEAQNEMDGPVFKIRDDPRITKPGKVLRRLSADELPQLWNILRGEMSLVGPRPPLPEEVAKYSKDAYRRRLAIRPGITGPWQVAGRSELSFERWMALDLDYVDNWTLAGDLWILARTVGTVLTGRGAM